MFRVRRIRSELPLPDPGVFIIEMSDVFPKPKFLAGVLQADDVPTIADDEAGTARNTMSSTDESSNKIET
jgi:hypothetical protein